MHRASISIATLLVLLGPAAIRGPSAADAVQMSARGGDQRTVVWERMAESYDKVEAIRISRPAHFGLPIWHDMAESYGRVESIRARR